MAESQKVTHPNRICHYIMVADVKKAKKATWLKKEEQEQEVEQKHHLSVTSFVKSHFSLFKGQMMLHAMRCLEDLGTLGFDIEVTR